MQHAKDAPAFLRGPDANAGAGGAVSVLCRQVPRTWRIFQKPRRQTYAVRHGGRVNAVTRVRCGYDLAALDHRWPIVALRGDKSDRRLVFRVARLAPAFGLSRTFRGTFCEIANQY